MSCVATPENTEFEFVRALFSRRRELGACCGPVLPIQMSLCSAFALERIFESPVAADLLWDASDRRTDGDPTFSLCAAHWIDLAALSLHRSRQTGQIDGAGAAYRLLRQVCLKAHWDTKEIVNLFQWQGMRLT